MWKGAPTMLAEWVMRRQVRKAFAGFEALDAAAVTAQWPEDHTLVFPAGLPMAGEWHGRAETTAVLQAAFDHNAAIRVIPGPLAVRKPWSPTGTMTVFAEISMEETGKDGDIYLANIISVADIRRWKVVRTRDFFADVPGAAAHYAGVKVPARRSVG